MQFSIVSCGVVVGDPSFRPDHCLASKSEHPTSISSLSWPIKACGAGPAKNAAYRLVTALALDPMFSPVLYSVRSVGTLTEASTSYPSSPGRGRCASEGDKAFSGASKYRGFLDRS